MATLYETLQTRLTGGMPIRFNLGNWLRENVTRSWWLLAWLVLIVYISVSIAWSQLQNVPVQASLILGIWVLTVGYTAVASINRRHSPISLWLKDNLYSSITNALLTLVLTLLIFSGLRAFIIYAFIAGSFSTNPEVAREAAAAGGARWGAVIANMRSLMLFRFPRAETWRVWAALILIGGLTLPSLVIYRGERYRRTPIRTGLTIAWLVSPIIIFFLLLGVEGSTLIRRVNPETAWGGLLLTMAISIFAIVASFPLGLLLALGRRSKIRGIPAWLTWTVAIVITAWGLLTSTPENLAAARTTTEQILSYWPLSILIFAYFFQRNFKGNVVALFSTVYIESVRGVPLITVLFMSIILFPLFLPAGLEIVNTWRVMVAFALFAAAYLAENVRGGLQAIPNGQYEAADALGLSTYKKYTLIILPQALRLVIPAIVGQFIALFKDTSLVSIVGLVDLLGAANLISSQPDWLGVRREPYIFIAIIYFVGCAIMAGYSRRLEKQLGVGER
ncbi:MAG: amino acid ABC transporter permease [Chloroflexota bacterium]|jgi:general L-amino acid transport system permease protein